VVNPREHAKAITLSLDDTMARACLPFMRERGRLLSFLFHGIYRNADELHAGSFDPQQGVTQAMLRTLLNHFKVHGYRFISPDDILRGLDPEERYVLITFDDGYFNNFNALPVLEEFDAPAVFFLSTGHIRQGRAYWWDVVFREFKKRRMPESEIHQAVSRLKYLKTEDVERDLVRDLGPNALQPAGDLDRPLTPAELRDFAGHPLVYLGNHTRNHAILTHYSLSEIREEIRCSQEDIVSMAGRAPNIIAYPNGNYSEEIVEAALEAGLLLGVTVEPGKNRVPIRSGPAAMKLNRFILWGDQDVDCQCRAFRSSFSLRRMITRSRLRRRDSERIQPNLV